jgi:hypothetical protein
VIISKGFFMIVCLVWFSLMTQEAEIIVKSSARGDSREARDFLLPGSMCTCQVNCGIQPRKFMFAISNMEIGNL